MVSRSTSTYNVFRSTGACHAGATPLAEVSMALRSTLFRGDPKLEAAATSDPAHIVPGARGPHVAKIQQALIQVGGAEITPDGAYGPATATAVADFKRKHQPQILNYLGKIDNIVGIKTMTALDLKLVALEDKPAELQSLYPRPISNRVQSGRPMLAFKFGPGIDRGPSGGGPAPAPALTDLVQAPVTQQVVIATRTVGAIEARGLSGGVLVLSEPPAQNSKQPLAKLVKGTNLRARPNLENADIVGDPETFNYQTFGECGFVKIQAVGAGSKKSGIADILILVSQSSYTDEPVHPVDSAFKSGLVSVRGTPLKPLAGRGINIFGRGETNGFENYSTDVKHCNDENAHTKPWTADPRRPGPGIANKSVKNISIRDSPIRPVTIEEIKRIAAPGCRVTFSGPRDDENDNMTVMRAAFVNSGLAKPIEDGSGAYGHTMVFELK
jgi:peptidoglycan hydrolase-like protein with peptidoglycan-binding domain